VAVTDALVNTAGEKARQTSDVPACPLVRSASCQVSPPPVTPVAAVGALGSAAVTNASSSSFGAAVVNVPVVSVVTVFVASLETATSIERVAVVLATVTVTPGDMVMLP